MEKDLKERLKRIEGLSFDPFNPEALRAELEDLIKDLPRMKPEELMEVRGFVQWLNARLEENYAICFGWVEKALKEGFRREV
ncbi:MAG: hypothetical protein ACK4FY_02425 [Aquificaceae bacterium]